MGLAQGADMRVVTERSRLGMPEVAIGYFPDVGGSYFLSRVPGELGTYLGVSGAQIQAAGALYCGLADWFLESDKIAALDAGLDKLTFGDHPLKDLQGLLAKLGAPEARLDDELFALLADYHWPGNIRQLEMVLRTALAMREPGENTLGLEHLPDSTLEELAAGERQPCGRIRETEMELIRQALDRHQGNVSAAADALGISRATLYRKLKQLKGG